MDTVVRISDQRVERTLETTGTVKQIQINRDSAAIAEFERF